MEKNRFKSIIIGLIGVSIGWIITKIKENKKVLIIGEKQEYLIYKQENVLNVYEEWIAAFQEKKRISDYLIDSGYHEIAIYGLGRLGKQLYEELINSKVNVSYIIDKKYSVTDKFYYQTKCYCPDDKLPLVDLIIITVPSEEKEISSFLKKKKVGLVKTMSDLLFVL